MSRWRARLFGSFSLARDGTDLDVPSTISKSLLTFLLASDAPVHRDVAIDRLWPDQSPTEARNTLSQAIWKFKNAVGADTASELLDVGHSWISLRPDSEPSVDVLEFDRLVRAAMKSGTARSDQRKSLETAVDLYRGDFALGLFEPWVLPQQRFYRNQMSEALEQLSIVTAADGDFVGSLATLRRLAEITPQRESVHQRIMKTLHLLGRRNEALEYFDELAIQYQTEYQRELSVSTRSLFRLIESSEVRDHPVRSDRVYVGRSSELEHVLKVVQASFATRGELVFVEGETGIGRSTFLEQLESELYWRECRVLRRACDETFAGSYATVVAVIRELLDGATVLRVESMVPAVWIAAAGRLIPELVSYLPTNMKRLPPIEDETSRTRESLIRVLVALLSDHPRALILDDIDKVDLDTAAMLSELIERLILSGCAVIVSYSSDALHVRPGVIEALSAADRVVGSETITLPRFQLHESEEFIQQAAYAGLSISMGKQLHEQSGGVPLYLALLVQGQMDDEEQERIPASLSAAVASRIRAIDSRDLEVAEVLAVADRGLTQPELSAVMGGRSLADSLERLARGGHIWAEDGCFKIDLEVTRDEILAALSIEAFEEWHRRMAVWMADSNYPELAPFVYHAAHGGLLEAAAVGYMLLAEESLSLHAPAAAARHFELAIAAGESGGLGRSELLAAVSRYVEVLASINESPDRTDLATLLQDLADSDAERLEALRLTAELFRVQDRFEEAVSACASGLALATTPDDRGAFGLLRGRIRRLQGDAVIGAAEVEDILAIEGISQRLRVQLLTIFGMLLLSTARTDELERIVSEGLNLTNDDILRADLLNVRALRDLEAGNIGESINQQLAVYELAVKVGYQHRMAVSQWNLSISYLNLDRLADAIASAETAMSIGRKIGSVYLETMAGLAMASALYETVGNDQQLDDLVRIARIFGRRHGVVSAETWAAELEALLLYDKGQKSEAQRAIDHAVERNRELDLKWGVLNALLSRSLIAIESGNAGAALLDLDEAERFRQELRSSNHLGPITAMRALALARIGNHRAAREAAAAGMAADMTWYSRHRSYLLLAEAFSECGDRARQAQAIEHAYDQLNRRVVNLPVGLRERAFRTNTAERIVESWMLTEVRHQEVTIRNQVDHPIAVEWTLSRPDDADVADLRERRRHRMRRMVNQARAAGISSPPIKQLARVFRVSETTVRRDLDTLRSRQPGSF